MHYPLEILLKITQLDRSVFFYHLKPKIDKNAGLRLKIVAIKQEDTEYGYRPVSALLIDVNHKRIQRLMKEMDLQVKPTRAKRYTSYQREVGKIAPNLLSVINALSELFNVTLKSQSESS